MINNMHRHKKQLQNEIINVMKLGRYPARSEELIPFHEFKHRAGAGVGAYLKMICIVVILVTIIILLVKVF